MAQQIGPARVYALVKIPHLIAYVLTVFSVFVVSMISMVHLQSLRTTYVSHWFDYDIPWFCEAALVWLVPVTQLVFYRKVSVTVNWDGTQSVCHVTGSSRLNGVWNLKKQPEIWVIVRFLLPVLLLLMLADASANVMALHHAIVTSNNAVKALAVQGMSQIVLLLGVFAPQVTFYKYPYIVQLRQKGVWLSLQYR